MAFDEPKEPAILRFVGRLIDLCLMLGGGLIVVLMFGNVASRFILRIDVAWVVELTGFILVWVTFLGSAAAARRRIHMRIGELVGLTRGRARLAWELLVQLVVVVILCQLVWYGTIIAQANMRQLMTVLYWPYGWLYAALPVGAALTLLYVLHDVARMLIDRRVQDERGD
jgi:TRAP-type transport system small permease protein